MTPKEYQALVDEAAARLKIIGTHSDRGEMQVFIAGQEAELAAARGEEPTDKPAGQ